MKTAVTEQGRAVWKVGCSVQIYVRRGRTACLSETWKIVSACLLSSEGGTKRRDLVQGLTIPRITLLAVTLAGPWRFIARRTRRQVNVPFRRQL